MLIKIKELCLVDYINEEDIEKEGSDKLEAIRVVVYDSPKNTLLEAFKDYDNNYDSDNVIYIHDEFDGGCLSLIKYISVEEIEEY